MLLIIIVGFRLKIIQLMWFKRIIFIQFYFVEYKNLPINKIIVCDTNMKRGNHHKDNKTNKKQFFFNKIHFYILIYIYHYKFE